MSSTSTTNEEMMREGMTIVAAAVKPPNISYLEERVKELYEIVRFQAIEIASLKKQIISINKTIFPFQEVSKPSEELIESVATYLKNRKEAYPSEIADALEISIKEVMGAISYLQEKNKVEEV
jgi:hypothetical protein